MSFQRIDCSSRNVYLSCNCSNSVSRCIGPTGPQGPTGPAGSSLGFGGVYNAFPDDIVVPPGGATIELPMPEVFPTDQLGSVSGNGIIIGQTGTYEISYGMSVSNATIETFLSMGILVDGSLEANTLLSQAVGPALRPRATYVGQYILEVAAGSKLTLALFASAGYTVTRAPGLNSYLIIKRIQ